MSGRAKRTRSFKRGPAPKIKSFADQRSIFSSRAAPWANHGVHLSHGPRLGLAIGLLSPKSVRTRNITDESARSYSSLLVRIRVMARSTWA